MPKIKQPVKKVVKIPAEAKSKPVAGLSIPVVGIDGKTKGTMMLPKELFGVEANPKLVAIAVRVYRANQRKGHASTKTRGEVEGSTKKIYRQKGTGRARHGGIRAPIFVGGGIAFGPRPRDFSLSLPQKMRRAALACALTQQYTEGNLVVVDGLEQIEPKTKCFSDAFRFIGVQDGLLVTGRDTKNIVRGVRNLADIDMLPALDLHTYAIVAHKKIILMKDAVQILKETFGTKS
ncbi:50S ribosomal protein L4 [Candidatus Gottesmanbacteria bacterium]|nr:50S ribosomal protein L4 [Candidatus Gottesmanbacteria bacterium]